MTNKNNKITFIEWETGKKTTQYFSSIGLELCAYLARNGGLNLVEDVGYYYNFNNFKKTLEELTKSRHWNYFKNY